VQDLFDEVLAGGELAVQQLVAVAVVPFGALSYFTLDPIRAILATVGVLVVAVLVAEHVASSLK
jgi:hypothetical protein